MSEFAAPGRFRECMHGTYPVECVRNVARIIVVVGLKYTNNSDVLVVDWQ